MALLTQVLSAALLLLWGVSAALLLVKLARRGSRHEATERHSRLLWWALAPLAFVTLVQGGFNATGGFGGFPLSFALALALGASGFLLAHYLHRAHAGHFGKGIPGATATGAILMATGAAAALLASEGAELRWMTLLEGLAAGAWALAFANARQYAKTWKEPGWIAGFALTAAYAAILAHYLRVLIYNAALQGGDHIWGYARLEYAAFSLFTLLFALPALNVAAKKRPEGESEGGPTRSLTPTGPEPRQESPGEAAEAKS